MGAMLRMGLLGGLMALATVGCGARTDLLTAGTESRDGGLPESGSEAGVDAATDAPSDTAVDTAVDTGPDADAPPCVLVSAGAPVEILAVPENESYTPSIVVADPGSDASPARVAVPSVIQGLSEIRLALPTIGPSWPQDVKTDVDPLVLGIDTFSYPQITRTVAGDDALIVTWLGGPGTIQIRWAQVSLPDLSFSGAKPLTIAGSTPVDLAAGRAMDPNGAGYVQPGVALATQLSLGGNPPQLQQPVVAMLDQDGNETVDEIPLIEPVESMAPNPSLIWTGDTYLTATAHRSCAPGDPLCVPNSIVVARLQPPSAPDFVPQVIVESVVTPDEGFLPTHPALALHQGQVYVAWFERNPDEPDGPRRAMLGHFDTFGQSPFALRTLITTDALPLESIGLTSTSFGLLVSWPEDGDTELPDGALGRSRMLSYRVEPDMTHGSLEVMDGPVTIDMTKYLSRAAPVGGALTSYGAAVLAWSAWSAEYGRNTIHLGRVDCVVAEL